MKHAIILLSAALAVTSAHEPLSAFDQARAHKPRPSKGSPVLHPSEDSSVAFTLNDWLQDTLPETSLRTCESFDDITELNDLIADLVDMAHPGLQQIYQSKCKTPRGCDKRSRRWENIGEYESEWEYELASIQQHSNKAAKSAVREVLRNGKCYEAVQIYYHHLSQNAQHKFTHSHKMGLPMLPQNREALDFLSDLYESRKVGEDKRRQLGKRNKFHGHVWSEDFRQVRDRVHNETLSQMEYDLVEEVLAKYNTQSPCEMAHRILSDPWTVEKAVEAGVDPEVAGIIAKQLEEDTFSTFGVDEDSIPDTATRGAGYIDCDAASVCLEGGDNQYMLQAVVRSYTVPGSGKIIDSNTGEPLGEDVKFHTRTFEAMPGSPSAWGPAKAGGDGTGGLLGPAVVGNPGETVHLFVKNNLGDTSALGPHVPTAQEYFDRIQVLLAAPNGTQRLDFAKNVPYNGPEWRQNEYPLKESKPVAAENMTAGAGDANVPGLETDGYDVFNVHMHGWETAPHLFYPPGTSDPNAPWVSIEPDSASGQQCMCYKFTLSETQSQGDFLYHTHRHGTTTLLTWSGMFGLSLTGEESVKEAREKPRTPPTLTHDLVQIANASGLELDDDDIHYAVIYDSEWNYKNFTNGATNETEVVVSDFITGERDHAQMHPVFVNNEYQPTIEAKTGHLNVFRLACVSAGNICAFQILEGAGESENATIIPFDRLASDGISYSSPVHRRGNGNAMVPDVSASEAYLSMGGGMREVVAVQFPKPGTYTIWQRSTAFDDSVNQLLMTVNVTGEDVEVKDITGLSLASARPPISEDREVNEYRGMTFGTDYNQEYFPFPYYGVGDINGEGNEAYNLTNFDIGAPGGTCGIWVIRNRDVMLHPFHIHVNPFMVLNVSSHFDANPELRFFVDDYSPPWDTVKGVGLSGIWRDTAWVPPYGYLVIKQCYDAGVRPSLGADVETFGGKFVFHCHFLVHEDTGLMRNVILQSQNVTRPQKSTQAPSSRRRLRH